ncbi:hypothetical protein S7711_11575, partial [Stachybotrys chartarum IBT 7711]
MPQAAADYN